MAKHMAIADKHTLRLNEYYNVRTDTPLQYVSGQWSFCGLARGLGQYSLFVCVNAAFYC